MLYFYRRFCFYLIANSFWTIFLSGKDRDKIELHMDNAPGRSHSINWRLLTKDRFRNKIKVYLIYWNTCMPRYFSKGILPFRLNKTKPWEILIWEHWTDVRKRLKKKGIQNWRNGTEKKFFYSRKIVARSTKKYYQVKENGLKKPGIYT